MSRNKQIKWRQIWWSEDRWDKMDTESGGDKVFKYRLKRLLVNEEWFKGLLPLKKC